MKIGINIRHAREQINISQSELASLMYYSTQSISNWERNVSIPSTETLILLSNILKKPLNYFIENDDNDIDLFKKDVISSSFKIIEDGLSLNIKNISIFSGIKEHKIIEKFDNIDNIIIMLIGEFDDKIKKRIISSLEVSSYKNISEFILNDLSFILYDYNHLLMYFYSHELTSNILSNYLLNGYEQIYTKILKSNYDNSLLFLNILIDVIKYWFCNKANESLSQFRNYLYELVHINIL